MTSTPPVAWYAATLDLLRRARARWAFVVGFTILGGAVATVIVLVLPSYYRSTAAFQAEATPQNQLAGALGGLASQFGNLSLGSPQNSPQFFADLVTTDAVLGRVAGARYPYQGAFLPLSTIYRFDDEPPASRDFHTVKMLRDAITLDVNARTNVVKFNVEARTPQLAQALAETTLADLNEANVDLRRARAAAEHQFTDDRATAARLGLDSADQALASFYQRNRSISSSPDLQMEEARLKRRVDMAQQVYVQLRMQAEQAGLQEVRNTPIVSIIDPPLMPVKRSRPNRRLAVALGLLIGLSLALTRLLINSVPVSPQRAP